MKAWFLPKPGAAGWWISLWTRQPYHRRSSTGFASGDSRGRPKRKASSSLGPMPIGSPRGRGLREDRLVCHRPVKIHKEAPGGRFSTPSPFRSGVRPAEDRASTIVSPPKKTFTHSVRIPDLHHDCQPRVVGNATRDGCSDLRGVNRPSSAEGALC